MEGLNKLDYFIHYMGLVLTALHLARVVPDFRYVVIVATSNVEEAVDGVDPASFTDVHNCLKVVFQFFVADGLRFVVMPFGKGHCLVINLDVVHPPFQFLNHKRDTRCSYSNSLKRLLSKHTSIPRLKILNS